MLEVRRIVVRHYLPLDFEVDGQKMGQEVVNYIGSGYIIASAVAVNGDQYGAIEYILTREILPPPKLPESIKEILNKE